MSDDLGHHIYWYIKCLKDLGINSTIEAYMQSVVIKKMLESVSLDYRRNEGTIEECHVEEMKLVEETRRMSL